MKWLNTVVDMFSDFFSSAFNLFNDFFLFSVQDGWDAGYFYECQFPSKREEKHAEDEQMFGAMKAREDEEKELVNAIKIPEINDVPITALCFR